MMWYPTLGAGLITFALSFGYGPITNGNMAAWGICFFVFNICFGLVLIYLGVYDDDDGLQQEADIYQKAYDEQMKLFEHIARHENMSTHARQPFDIEAETHEVQARQLKARNA